MKKNYVKPEVFTEDVRIAFAGTCCTGEPYLFNPASLPRPWCGGDCTIQVNYTQA